MVGLGSVSRFVMVSLGGPYLVAHRIVDLLAVARSHDLESGVASLHLGMAAATL